MSNHTTAAEEIKRAWLFAWNAGPLASMPIEHTNLRFQQPAGAPWGRLTLLTGESSPAAIGNGAGKLTRTPFFLLLQVFLPENSGTKVARQAADAMAALDRATIYNEGLSVAFGTTSLTEVANPANTGMAQYNVEIQGRYDLSPADGEIDGGLPGSNFTFTSPIDGGTP